MLELKNIKKIYILNNFKQTALNEISINFRKNEFVSILGPSGSGKTTLLNIIGGLDKYTSGDLIIDGISTKKYKDKNWDSYRNHRVGFVFQSYNLIPHQSVLKNVEMSLILSGVKKSIIKKKAIDALTMVGLKDHINKRPNQLSGGQMQRVAIARALVNDPDILLADEPTGALDTETSIQIMQILKEISKDKLVIMVTHNPELAKNYSTRIIEILDGKLTSDSNPYNTKSDKVTNTSDKKTNMNFITALNLSLNNLLTKKGRTLLTAFAGSIGIIGIALILSLSNGMQNYINKIQEDTLTSYPISIEENTYDMSAMLGAMMQDNDKVSHNLDKIYSNNILVNMLSSMTAKEKTNNLTAFKEYIIKNKDKLSKYTNDIKYKYNLKLQIFSNDKEYKQLNPVTILENFGYSNDLTNANQFASMSSTYDVWRELSENTKLLNKTYDIVTGKLPDKMNEVVLIVNENNEISDYTLYALNLLSQNELARMMQSIMMGEKIENKEHNYSYEEILNTTFKLILNTDYYSKENGIWKNNSINSKYMKSIIDNGLELKVVGIIRPKKDANIESSTGQIAYTKELTDYVINSINESKIVKEQKSNSKINVLTSHEFTDNESYQNNLVNFGVVDINKPSVINLYPNSFESKDEITKIIDEYNNSAKEEDKIEYTDYVGLLMNSVTTIVNIISYVLIAFVSISLIVSSIMIGIITYISVLERTKEIGILRAIGASKKDIRRVFNAETFIIGTLSGTLGILITVILNIPINKIIKSLTDINSISVLPIKGAIILIAISILLTIISGFIPAKYASKKDPVIALRTE